MYAFFVLGLIPGTNLQITFNIWLDCLLLATAIYLYARYLPVVTIERMPAQRQVIYASQLHQRAL